MVMTEDRPTDSSTTHELLPPTYGVLDFNAPATIGIVLYESQLTRGQLRKEFTTMGEAIRGDIALMGQSLREEMTKTSRNIIAIVITLHSITVSAIFAAAAVF